MTCDHCGAAIKDSGAFCSHCGTRITRPERDEPAIRAATDPARYDLAKATPGYRAACGHVPKLGGGATAAGVLVPIAMVGFCIFFIATASRMGALAGGAGILFVLVPCVMIAAAVWMVGSSVRFAKAPVTNELAVVVDERTSTSGGGDTSVSTSYYATLQTRDGARLEYPTYGWIAGRIAPGDIGVAFLKGGRLVDFLRLDA